MNIHKINIKDRLTIFHELILLTIFTIFGILGRILLVGLQIQPFPNFEIIMVLTFLAAIFIRPTFAFLVPLLSMIGSDLLLGNSIFIGSHMNKIILFTYTGFLIISILSTITRKQSESRLRRFSIKNMMGILGMGVFFVIIYDLWTNLGWWYLMYPLTIKSFIAVFLAGIPFMLYHILSVMFTFTLIAIPVANLVFNKTPLPLNLTQTLWDKVPVVTVTVTLFIVTIYG
jgi:hypothetical protein